MVGAAADAANPRSSLRATRSCRRPAPSSRGRSSTVRNGRAADRECRYASIQRAERRPTRRQARGVPMQRRALPAGYESTDLTADRGRATARRPPTAFPQWASINLRAEEGPQGRRPRTRRLFQWTVHFASPRSRGYPTRRLSPGASPAARHPVNRWRMSRTAVAQVPIRDDRGFPIRSKPSNEAGHHSFEPLTAR
jgi:hypothetical protein